MNGGSRTRKVGAKDELNLRKGDIRCRTYQRWKTRHRHTYSTSVSVSPYQNMLPTTAAPTVRILQRPCDWLEQEVG